MLVVNMDYFFKFESYILGDGTISYTPKVMNKLYCSPGASRWASLRCPLTLIVCLALQHWRAEFPIAP